MVQSRHGEVANYCQLFGFSFSLEFCPQGHAMSTIVFKETLHFRCQQCDSVYVGERIQQWKEVVDDGTIQT